MNQLLKPLGNEAVIRAAYEINGAYLRYQSGELKAAVELGYLLANLRNDSAELVQDLVRILYLVNANTATFVKEFAVFRNASKPAISELKHVFKEARAGNWDAFEHIALLARNAAETQNIENFLELGIEDPAALQFLMGASSWINRNKPTQTN